MGNDKPVPTPGAPADKSLPDIDLVRGRLHAPPKAPPAIPSSRRRWSPSSLPTRLVPPAVPVTPQVITGNTESAGVVLNNQNDRDPDASFAARHGLLASAAAGLRDTVPPVYWSAAIPPMISEAYAMMFASAGSIQEKRRAHSMLDKEGCQFCQLFPNVRQTGMSVLLKTLEPQTYANGFVMSSPASLPVPVPFERLVISEFRFRGPGGVADEYIQFTNITGQSIVVSTSDGSSGWGLAAISSSGSTSTKFVIPNGTKFQPGAHYLAANSAYSLGGYATVDRSYTGDISDNTGIALFRTANAVNFTLNERIDAAGFTPVTNSLYREGSGMTSTTAGTNEYAHVRKLTTTLPQDTDNNSADFVTISTSAASLGGVASVLGAPGPENSLSPLDRTSQILYESLDPGAGATAPPNWVRNTTPVPNGAFGTLAIRTKITNNTGFPITRMRFRIMDFTTTNSPVVVTPPQAQLTMLDSADSNITLSNGTTVSVKGSKVEQPPNQPNAGGINTTHAPGGITLTTPLQPGQSFYREMKFGVNASGTFRYNATVELLLAGGASADPSQDNFSAARLDPANRTGSSGEDLASRNLNWSLPLVSLPGRAGLDLGLSLAYNSLVWTKSLGSGSAIRFDADNGFPGPGFRLGFPVIERRYYDSSIAANAYLMITPSGRRVQLRQIGASNVYEAGDSSYLQLTDNGSTLLVRPTDGSQLTYSLRGDAYYCTQIKDRNGNFITASYGGQGQLLSVLDTLGRVIHFNYDSYQNLLSITQTRNIGTPSQTTHTWATFGYSDRTIETNYPGLNVVGPGNGSVIPLLTQVGLADGTKYNFTYNTWGQVYRVSRSTPRSDNPALYRERNYTRYNLPLNAAGSQSDCPRFTERREWAENWNGDSDSIPVTGEEALTTFSPHNFAGGVTTVTVPDGTQYKEFFTGTSPAWKRGLTTQTETWSAGVRRKWTSISWTQDDTSLAYPKNPRVVETNIYDETGNRKRTTIDYGPYVAYGLPYLVTEYGSGGAGIMRQSYTDYKLDSAYLSRRIIGLVSSQQVSNGSTWQSKTVYAYDAGGSQLVATASPAIQHDPSYGTGFLSGRGNVTSVARYDVNDINNATKALTTTIGYDVDGSVVFTRDPSWHQNSLSYTDAFADGIARNTFAYPTTATDAGGYTSTSKYSFDTGSVTQQQTPQPNTTTNQPGPIQTFAYDVIGRIQRVTSLNNGAFTEFAYPEDLMMVQSFTTIRDDSIGNPNLRAYSAKAFDGAGRVMGTIGSHPGSVGGYKAQDINYDVMGRAIEQSNPTETNGSWVPSGDDAAGWLYTRQTYDWNGRPRITTNPDGTTKEASYSGCGCAGGAVVTLTDEGTMVNGVPKKRQQKIYADVLGRTVKTEVLNWDGTGPFGTGGSVYSATVNDYNARDQITQVKQYAGPEGSPTFQDTTMIYDGYGRLKTKHVPEQNAGTATTWDYNSDDTIQKVTDARASVSNFTYNSRHLITGVTYDPSSGISDTPDVSFGYDAAGNRTSMTDGLGSASYAYNQLSQMISEQRILDGVGTFPLSYGYNLAGMLTSITDSFGAQVGYNRDTAGRVTSVTGVNFAGVSTYASNLQYRAWGALKHLDYGNSRALNMTYNSLLQPASFTVPSVMSKTYDYHSDGRLKFSHDLLDAQLDRSYAHDHAGRITEALSGAEARNEGTTDNRPYKQTFVYDAFGHLTQRPVKHLWAKAGGEVSPAQYNNERNTAWTYDADGNLINSFSEEYTIDAAGQTSRFISHMPVDPPPGQPIEVYGVTLDVTQTFDGDGQAIKKLAVNTTHGSQAGDESTFHTTYLLRSSVLGGQVITELGASERGFVYLGGSVLAVQERPTQTVKWEHRDIGNASLRMTASNGTLQTEGLAELDPLGSNAGVSAPETPSPAQYWKMSGYPGLGSPGTSMTCIMDFVPTPCTELAQARNSIEQCPENDCGPRIIIDPNGREHLVPLTRNPDTGHLSYRVTYEVFNPNWEGPDDMWKKKSEYLDVAGEPQNSTFDVPGITNLVNQELADPNCAKFAETIRNQLSKGQGGSLRDVFKAFLNQPKAHELFTRTAPPGSRGEATAIGSLKNSTAAMFLVRSTNQTVRDANGVIGELFHFAGGPYSDKDLAQALNKTAYASDAREAFPDGTANIFDKRYRPNGWSDADGYSTYFHGIHNGTVALSRQILTETHDDQIANCDIRSADRSPRLNGQGLAWHRAAEIDTYGCRTPVRTTRQVGQLPSRRRKSEFSLFWRPMHRSLSSTWKRQLQVHVRR